MYPPDPNMLPRHKPTLSLHGDLFLYYAQIRFVAITIDNRMNFVKPFEDILKGHWDFTWRCIYYKNVCILQIKHVAKAKPTLSLYGFCPFLLSLPKIPRYHY